ncbi:MAG: methyltransferase domain-containing protein [Gaiellaceae bacterium]
MKRADDPALVASQYATEDRLQARRSVYQHVEGPDAREVAFAAIAEGEPRRVLEVGGGPGELSARMIEELGTEVVMLDVSERMVELARAKGVDARVGDVQDLPFPDDSFDCAVAAWMLYHVPDLDRGLSELARVAPRLVAVTNGIDHMRELKELAGDRAWEPRFRREEAEAILLRHYSRVERRDVDGWVTMDAQAARAFIESLGDGIRAEVEGPVRARTAPGIFVARR